MKDSYYFPHDYSARNDQKILMVRGDFGLNGYALFRMCLESMAEQSQGKILREAIGGLSISYGHPKDELIGFIDYCIKIGLFKEDETGIFSLRMKEHKEMREALSKAGKEGANKRWKNRGANSGANAKKGKERKESKEIKDSSSGGEPPKKRTLKILTWEEFKVKIVVVIDDYVKKGYNIEDLKQKAKKCFRHYENGIKIATTTYENWLEGDIKKGTLLLPAKKSKERTYINDDEDLEDNK